ncbi:hypothetical protein L1987_53340 [Smallanthus sonchifolius]|uniref:Uncharacterized protein n=1 Tax=Smallanthus sonchifolius TaxID=185202 RepID=A0ACB9EW94_9ASTR|nr:hypothetical protein L1987_53340 [Smallanthus sonchifolius]
MAPTSTKTLAHFMHPPHRLTELTANTPYHCDGCKVAGTGTRFTCTICKFNLHDYCAKCPNTWVIFTTKHVHQLSLFLHRPKVNQTQPCQICHSPVEGLAYQCEGCKYLVHPLCVSDVKDSTRVDRQDVVELAAGLSYETSFATSNVSNGFEAPSSHSSGFTTSGGGDHGGVFEAIIRGIGHLFEASSE